MRAVIVYESHWGNTEAIARAIAEGYGPDAVALTTQDALPSVVASADLIVAGAPVLGFSLPTDGMVEALASEHAAPSPPETSRMTMRAWLAGVARGHGTHAAFETRIWWSPMGATGTIERSLEAAGYAKLGEPRRFIVDGKYGPLRPGELEKARQWGADLAAATAASA